MKKLILPIFILLVLVQWYVPGKMIWNKEQVFLSGKEFKFETEPLDPVHPFKGRYINLSFKEDSYTVRPKQIDQNNILRNGQTLYVELAKDSNGFAKIVNADTKLPPSNKDFIEAKVDYTEYLTPIGKGFRIHIEFPFEEYYLDEYKTQKAEDLYRSANRDSTQKTYAVVKVLNGDAVIKDIIINGRPIHDWFR
jgi:uncharacterized membrane-anchored protein